LSFIEIEFMSHFFRQSEMTLLERREWDSAHFGFSVATINSKELAQPDLERTLVLANQLGYTLIYWPTRVEHSIDDSLIQRYGGNLVDCKTTYGMNLTEENLSREAMTQSVAVEVEIRSYTVSSADSNPDYDQRMRDLAIAAGKWSRFAVDSRIEKERHESLYTIWLERSLRRELADEVLVAYAKNSSEPIGIVTLLKNRNIGSVELIAVSTEHRGRGIGKKLMQAGEQWMRDQGCSYVRVVTQKDNLPACRLYEQHGYAVVKQEQFYHFWLKNSEALAQKCISA
jgi:dTDP-4-amino-4,6-dideoxy-D-galactose acyltransferase